MTILYIIGGIAILFVIIRGEIKAKADVPTDGKTRPGNTPMGKTARRMGIR